MKDQPPLLTHTRNPALMWRAIAHEAFPDLEFSEDAIQAIANRCDELVETKGPHNMPDYREARTYNLKGFPSEWQDKDTASDSLVNFMPVDPASNQYGVMIGNGDFGIFTGDMTAWEVVNGKAVQRTQPIWDAATTTRSPPAPAPSPSPAPTPSPSPAPRRHGPTPR